MGLVIRWVALAPSALAVMLAGCPKVNDGDGGAGPGPEASAAPVATPPASAAEVSPSPAPPASSTAPLALDGPECRAMRDEVASLATAARRCTSAAGQCRSCIQGHIHHCGIFVGDETSPASREYLAKLNTLIARGCMLPTTATPPCEPDTAGRCGADGLCAPESCNLP